MIARNKTPVRDDIAPEAGESDWKNRQIPCERRSYRALLRGRAFRPSLDYGGAEPALEAARVRRHAERRGFDPLHPASEIVVPAAAPRPEPGMELRADPPAPRRPERQAEPPRAKPAQAEPSKASPVRGADLAAAVAAGRAEFRERFAAHRREQARLQDEAAARALVARWDALANEYGVALRGRHADPALGEARERLVAFGHGLREQPGVVGVLREQGGAFGLAERRALAQVVADPDPAQRVAAIAAAAEARAQAQAQALAQVQAQEREAARQEAKRQEAARPRQGPTQSRGPSMGY